MKTSAFLVSAFAGILTFSACTHSNCSNVLTMEDSIRIGKWYDSTHAGRTHELAESINLPELTGSILTGILLGTEGSRWERRVMPGSTIKVQASSFIVKRDTLDKYYKTAKYYHFFLAQNDKDTVTLVVVGVDGKGNHMPISSEGSKYVLEHCLPCPPCTVDGYQVKDSLDDIK